jgi:16S rRNA (guanine966-N2)-methyltransferase
MAGKGKGGGQIRIIGGRWRGRKLQFADAPGLRPTPDRVRETLFNWLATDIRTARCLDLFAGSGALGLEALSRGADHCTFVEASVLNANNIRQHLTTLDCERGEVVATDAIRWLRRNTSQAFDIIFLDPPFDGNLLAPAGELLAASELLKPGALIYLETAVRDQQITLPANWTPRSDKQAGEVRYRLFVQES